ncbi:putative mitochondrial protein [Tanacetum coccineum]
MVRITNVEVMEQYNQLELRLSIQEKLFVDLQSTVSELSSTVLQLKKGIDEDLKAGLNCLIADYHNRMKLDIDPDSSFVTGGSLDQSYVEVTDGQSHSKVNKLAYQLVNRLTKLEFPAFNGDRFKEWSYRCQQFFKINETPKNLKIRLVAIHLRGEALSWHQAYTKEVDVPPDVLLDLYLGGLPPKLLHTINLFDPKTVNQAMRLARLQKGAYYALWGLDVPKSQSFHNDSSGYEKNKSSFLPSPSALPFLKFLPSVSQSQSTSAPKKPYTPTTFPKPYIKPSNTAPNQYPTTNNTFTKNTPSKTPSKREYDERGGTISVFLVMRNVKEVDVSTGTENNYMDESSEGHDSLAMSIHARRPEFEADFFAMPIGGYDVVLGINWLSTLGEINDVFYCPTQLLQKRILDHSIKLTEGSNPVNLKAYRHGPLQKNVIEKMVKEMLDNGIIRESQSEFASLVVLVKKKDGTWRFCVDYRKLNNITVKNQFPIPIVEELLDELQGACLFSKPLDLKSSYHQVRMHDSDIPKTAFITHDGLYEFIVMPFGLSNAPATFQNLMNSIFRKHLRKYVLVFFNDILVYSKSWEEHIRHLQAVLSLLRQHTLYAKMSKFTFASQQVDYLGHIISKDVVKAESQKVEAMLAKQFTELLKKGSFSWSTEATLAFEKLKLAISSTPILALPDFDAPFMIGTDASGRGGIGAVLSQYKHPIAYFSKALGPRHLQLSTYKKELIAIVVAIQKWKNYLLLKSFVIKTDHQALKHILEQKECNSTLQKWLSKLIGLQYSVLYQEGKENVVADALSRKDFSDAACWPISSVQTEWKDRIHRSVVVDGKLLGIIDGLKEFLDVYSAYSVQDEVLYKKGKVVVGDDPVLRMDLIKKIHDNALGGHSGFHATHQILSRLFYWRGMQAMVRTYVRDCLVCQQCKYDTSAYPSLLQPLEIPSKFWSVITMDFITGLSKSQGYSVIYVVVDKLSKFAHFMALKDPYTTTSIANSLMNNVTSIYGIPEKIISDRDLVFLTLQEREAIVQLLKYNLLKAQNRMKMQADKHRSERVFRVGDWVFLKLQPYIQQSLHAKAFHKLVAKYYDPYKIVARVGEVAYKLDLPESSKIHDVFHVSLLKKSHGNHFVSSALPVVSDLGHFIPLPLKILDKRMIKKNNVVVAEVLVHWSNTWEEVQKL